MTMIITIGNIVMLPVMIPCWIVGFISGCIVRSFMKGFIS